MEEVQPLIPPDWHQRFIDEINISQRIILGVDWKLPEKKGTSKIIGIVGSRRRDSNKDYELVAQAFDKVYVKGDTICSGLCPKGGDRFAVVLAGIYETPTLWFPAEWDKHGKAAGFLRNTDIAQNSDILIACVADNREGGTEDTIKKFIYYKDRNNLILV